MLAAKCFVGSSEEAGMSRVGKYPVEIPAGVTCTLALAVPLDLPSRATAPTSLPVVAPPTAAAIAAAAAASQHAQQRRGYLGVTDADADADARASGGAGGDGDGAGGRGSASSSRSSTARPPVNCSSTTRACRRTRSNPGRSSCGSPLR